MYQSQLSKRASLSKGDHFLLINEDVDLALVDDVEVVSFVALLDDLVPGSGKSREHRVKDLATLNLVQMAEKHLKILGGKMKQKNLLKCCFHHFVKASRYRSS